jgi:hypothetical protein
MSARQVKIRLTFGRLEALNGDAHLIIDSNRSLARILKISRGNEI